MPDGALDALHTVSLMEQLAAAEHARWSHWQRYLHSQCDETDDGSLVIPAALVARWTEQMSMDYADLPEAAKESDREQVRKYLPLIDAALRPAGNRARRAIHDS